jgi:hypothetical protein
MCLRSKHRCIIAHYADLWLFRLTPFACTLDRVGTDHIRRLCSVYVHTRIYGLGLERGKPYAYVIVVFKGVFAGGGQCEPCNAVPRKAAANIAMQ